MSFAVSSASRGAAFAPGPRKVLIDSPAAVLAQNAVKKCFDKKVDRAGCIGITTYIRDTCRNGVPFSATRSSNARGRAGLSIGRVTDHMMQKWCNNEPISTGYARKYLDNAATALYRERLMPIATQVPCKLNHLKTEIDLICLRQGKTGNVGIVIVELKTSRQTLAQHKRSYPKRCLRKPFLDVGGYENSEAVAHRIQADFGRKALLNTFGHLKPFHTEAAVLYTTETGANIYPVEPLPPAVFDVHAVGRDIAKTHAFRFPLMPSTSHGGILLREALAAKGHKKIAVGGKASATSVNRAGKKCTLGIVSRWRKLRVGDKRKWVNEIKKIAATDQSQPWLLVREENGHWKAAVAQLNI